MWEPFAVKAFPLVALPGKPFVTYAQKFYKKTLNVDIIMKHSNREDAIIAGSAGNLTAA